MLCYALQSVITEKGITIRAAIVLIYSGTNLYTKGKYVEKKDENGKTYSVYEPELVDQQVGAYVLLSSLMEE